MKIKLSTDSLQKVYLLLLLINVVYIGGFCIYPAIKNLNKKTKQIKYMSTISTTLQGKKTTFNKAPLQLKALAPHIEMLDKNIPSDENLESYLISITKAASQKGYAVTGFKRKEKDGNAIILDINFRGNALNNIAELVKNIEKLDRLTTVNLLKLSADEEVTIGMNITVYDTT